MVGNVSGGGINLTSLLCVVGFRSIEHFLRHSFRDRLRKVECPPDIFDEIGGWARIGTGDKYGCGHDVEALHRWISKI